MTVAHKIGKKFVELVKEEFPPDHPYRSVLNEHTVKFSYSVQPNLKKKIAHHYMKVSQSEEVVSVTDDDYDLEDTTDYDLEEVIPEIVPDVPVPVMPSPPTLPPPPLEPEAAPASPYDDYDKDCGGLVVEPVPPPLPPTPTMPRPPPPPPPPASSSAPTTTQTLQL